MGLAALRLPLPADDTVISDDRAVGCAGWDLDPVAGRHGYRWLANRREGDRSLGDVQNLAVRVAVRAILRAGPVAPAVAMVGLLTEPERDLLLVCRMPFGMFAKLDGRH